MTLSVALSAFEYEVEVWLDDGELCWRYASVTVSGTGRGSHALRLQDRTFVAGTHAGTVGSPKLISVRAAGEDLPCVSHTIGRSILWLAAARTQDCLVATAQFEQSKGQLELETVCVPALPQGVDLPRSRSFGRRDSGWFKVDWNR